MSAPTPQSIHDRNHRAGPMSQCRSCAGGWATCRRKKRYETLEDAATASLRYNIDNAWGRPLVSYRCPYCTRWHLVTARSPAQLKRVRKQQTDYAKLPPSSE